jgi:hypothetical protein
MKKKITFNKPKPVTTVRQKRSRAAQMLTPDELAAEEEQYRVQKVLDQSPRFHSQLAAQLCWKSRASLFEFDHIIAFAELRDPELQGRKTRIVEAIAELVTLMDTTESHLNRLHQDTGSLNLISNQSTRPVICPPEAIGRHQRRCMSAKFSQEHALLEKLMRFDALICDALLLRKFGFLMSDQWDVLIKPITEQWRTLFSLSKTNSSSISASEFFGISLPKNEE